MTTRDIYHQYQIMPSLQRHMLWVAGVANSICENLRSPIDTENVLKACLLHDMGNILKFDLDRYPDFVQPEGKAYWHGVKNEFHSKYGPDVHDATLAIAREIQSSQRVLELIEAVGFDQTTADFESGDLGKMICEYSDCRVTPLGVTSLEERLQDLELRYGSRYPLPADVAKRMAFREVAREMELRTFDQAKILPGDINNQQSDSYKEFLLNVRF